MISFFEFGLFIYLLVRVGDTVTVAGMTCDLREISLAFKRCHCLPRARFDFKVEG